MSIYAGLYVVMVASSADFNTPFGYQTNLMIREPGGYSFSDYPKLGFPLTLIGMFLVPGIAVLVWPPGSGPCLIGAIGACVNTTLNATRA